MHTFAAAEFYQAGITAGDVWRCSDCKTAVCLFCCVSLQDNIDHWFKGIEFLCSKSHAAAHFFGNICSLLLQLFPGRRQLYVYDPFIFFAAHAFDQLFCFKPF